MRLIDAERILKLLTAPYRIDDGTDDPALLPRYRPNCGARMEDPDHD